MYNLTNYSKLKHEWDQKSPEEFVAEHVGSVTDF